MQRCVAAADNQHYSKIFDAVFGKHNSEVKELELVFATTLRCSRGSGVCPHSTVVPRGACIVVATEWYVLTLIH